MKWIGNVWISNFKQQSEFHAQFKRGVCVIKGESDLGKSTILKAIKKCLLNLPDRKVDSFLTWGAPRGSITEIIVGIKDNHDGLYSDEDAPETLIKRRMGKTINEYVIVYPDGKEIPYTGFGKQVPPEVMQVHGMRIVDMGYGKEALNFIDQFDGFFLISKRPEEIAVAIGRLARTEVIENVRDSIRSDISRNTRSINIIKDDIKTKNQDLLEYGYLDDEAQLIALAETAITEMKRLGLLRDELVTFSVNIEKIAKDIRIFEARRNDKTDYKKALDTLRLAEKGSETLTKVRVLSKDVETCAGWILDAEDIIRHTPDIAEARRLIDLASDKINTYSKVRELAFKIAATSKEIGDYSRKASQAIDLEAFKDEIQKAEAALKLKETLAALMKKIETTSKTLRRESELLKQHTKEYSDISEQIKEAMKDNCPVCGQSLTGVDFETLKAHIAG